MSKLETIIQIAKILFGLWGIYIALRMLEMLKIIVLQLT